MSRKRNLKSCWLVLLLLAETVQGLTPDYTSLASARLLNILAERGASLVISLLDGGHSPIPTELPSRPSSSDPFEDTEADEVCLASSATCTRLAVSRARNLQSARLRTYDRDRPPHRTACRTAGDGSLLSGGSRALLLSLCRLTC
jgi:hypothetical protein